MTREYTIRLTRAENGWVLHLPGGLGVDEAEPDHVAVFPEDGEDGELTAWVAVLRALTDALGPTYSRYATRTLHFDLRPGHKLDTTDDVRWFLDEVCGLDAPTEAEAAAVTSVIETLHTRRHNQTED